MALGSDDGQSSGGLDVVGELDVGTTTGHVGGDGHGSEEALLFADVVVGDVGELLVVGGQLVDVFRGGYLVAEGASVGAHPCGALRALTGECHDVGLFLVELGIQHLVWNLAHGEHLRQHFGDFHGGGTHEGGSSVGAHLDNLFDDGAVFLACGLVDAVVHIVAHDGAVGGYLDDVELVDVPELACLGDGGTGHTGQLVVHAEVVLEGDGGEGLRGGFHLHVLLGLDGLMESVAPAASLHDTSCLLVHNLHLAVDDDIFVVLVEHAIGLEQLLEGVHALALDGVVGHELVFLVDALFLAKRLVGLEGGELGGDVGKDEEVFIVHLCGEPVGSLVGEVARVEFLVDHEVEGLHGLGHASVVVLHVDLLGLQHAGLDAFFGEILDERLVLGETLERTVEREEAFVGELLVVVLLAFGNLLLGVGQVLCGQLALHVDQSLYEGLILLEHLVVALGHGSADDERGAGVVDEHGVDLVDDGIVVGALHEVGRRDGHVVAQVVETELVVGSEGDVGLVGLAALGRVGAMLVDAIHRQAVELVERSHPLGVTLGQIVVDRHHVDAVSGEGVEEDGERCHERLTFTRCHLGDFSLVEHLTAEELHIVVNHLPFQVVSASRPVVVVDGLVAVDGDEVFGGVGGQLAVEVGGRDDGLLVLGKAACGVFHNAESHGHHVVEGFFIDIERLFLQFVDLVEDGFTLVDGCILDGCLELGNLLFLLTSGFLYVLLNLFGLGT